MKKYNLIKSLFVLSLILSIVCSLFVSASAADEPTDSNLSIIPAGTYRWNQNLDLSTLPNGIARIDGSFSFPSSSGVFNGITYTVNVVGSVDSLALSYIDSGEYLGPLIAFSNLSADNPVELNFETSEGVQILEGSFIFPYYNGTWGSIISTTNFDITGSDLGYTFIINEDISIDDSGLSTWFFSNTTLISSPEYVIESGFYKARDNWTTAGWPVTDDSIDFRYYSPYQQTYIEAEGIAFLIENDIVSIWYMDDNIFADGWNNDAAKNIEVTSDISVEPEFYTVFNNIFAPSSQGSNDFDAGYAAGYDDGFSVGRDAGYTQGYYDGMADSSGNFFTDILGGVLGSLDAFTLFGGYSLLDLITTLLGGFALIWILKLLAGG